jgi:hypothetical protein
VWKQCGDKNNLEPMEEKPTTENGMVYQSRKMSRARIREGLLI